MRTINRRQKRRSLVPFPASTYSLLAGLRLRGLCPGFGLILSLALLAGCEHEDRAALVTPNGGSRTKVFFVATNGNDRWSGTLAAPNRNKSDGPFGTIPRALQASRDFRSRDSVSTQPLAIYVRSGCYFLNTPLILKPEDSGLRIAAYGNEKPIISGGRQIRGWKEITLDDKKLWIADIPEAREGQWFFHELWVNGSRATRARHPNKGYLRIADLPDATPEWTQGHTRFRFHEGDLKAGPSITNAEVVAMTRWVESRLPILSVDEKERIVSFGRKSVFQLAPDDLYYVEHALEFLDEPGEWYLDRSAGTLYYMARPGEQMAQIEAIAPVLSQVVRLEGRPEAGQFVEGVTLQGLTFAHVEWNFPPGFQGGKGWPLKPSTEVEKGGFAQAAVGVPGAIWGEGVHGGSIENCVCSHVGTYGIELTRGCVSNRIAHCDFSDLGAGGLKIGEAVLRDKTEEQTRATEITDCEIHDGGKLFASAVGIWIGQSPDNRITHNHIHDFFYTGISIGWTWGYGRTLSTNNLVAFNHVHHIGIKSDGDGPILSDMAGIYTLGMQPGTKILNNVWHDMAAIRYGGWGIYFDEGSSSILAASNLVYRTTHGGFHQHYGATNVLRNNIFAFGRDQQIQRTRPEPHASFSFETNIVYFDHGTLLGSDWSGDKYQMDSNVYFDARPNTPPDSMRFAGATLEQWRERGHDLHSIIADPKLRAPDKDDFKLLPDSPALKLGFQPIDVRAVGIRPP
jgi:hypothetical protein